MQPITAGRQRIRSARLWAAVLLSLLPAAEEVGAQSWRMQGSWVAGEVGGGIIGPELRRPMGGAPPLPLPGTAASGPLEVTSSAWHATGMVGLGANGVPSPGSGGGIDPLVYLHAGVLYRTGRSLPGYVGLVAASYISLGSVGPAALLEAADVAAVQFGFLYGDRAWRGHVALTIGLRFLRDVLGG
jgi:hypothetical protein